jgi:small subunit ribosomal protein S20
LANSPQAKKRAKQAEKNRIHNMGKRSEMRTYLKQVVKAVEANNLELAKTIYVKASSVVDKLANKGLIHKNKAARHKSRLNALIKKSSEAVAA